MPTTAQRVARLERLRENLEACILLMTQSQAANDRASIDAVFYAADAAGLVRPLVDYSLDGASYSWASAIKTYADTIEQVNKLLVQAGGPFQYKSLGR